MDNLVKFLAQFLTNSGSFLSGQHGSLLNEMHSSIYPVFTIKALPEKHGNPADDGNNNS